MKILVSTMQAAAFCEEPNMLALVVLKMMLLSRYGIAPEHAPSFAAYGVILIVGLWDFNEAVNFGRLGLKLIERLNARDKECSKFFGMMPWYGTGKKH
jgi:hypothetical protein